MNDQTKAYVIVPCLGPGEKVPVEKVEVLDCEEDFRGRDLLTFRYDGVIYKSNVYRP